MIEIGTIKFDEYTGDIVTPKLTVRPYVRSDIAHAGAQVLPTAGEMFKITTRRYEAPATVEATKTTLTDSIGQLVTIVDNGLSYAATYSVQFVIVDVHHRQIQSLIRAVGVRDGVDYNIAPAVALDTVWELIATPTP